VGAIAVDGDRAYVTDSSRLQLYDLSDRDAPVPLGSVPLSAATWVRAAAGFAYVGQSTGGLAIVDVGDAASPRQVSSVVTDAPVYDIAIVGDVGYAAEYGGGLRVLDLADRTRPREAAALALPGAALGLAASGRHLHRG